MTIDFSGLTSAMEDHALAVGYFSVVNKHEPKTAPTGPAMAIWADKIGPARGSSGVSSTTALVTFLNRIYMPMLTEPQDMIDPAVLDATGALMARYTADFTLGDRCRKIDLLGEFGVPLSGQAGYLQIGQTMLRVMTITVPVVVNDAWDQSP